MGATYSVLRAAAPALKSILFRRHVAVLSAIAFSAGVLLPNLLKIFFPHSVPLMPHTILVASFFIDLAGLALLLSWLPAHDKHEQPWLRGGAVLGTWAVMAFAFLGMKISGTHEESARTLATLWALFAAQAAAVAAIHSLLWIVLGPARQLATQIIWLMLAVAATALFWSREPIQMMTRARPGSAPAGATRAADAVIKLSPPMAVASAWYQESDAARAPRTVSDQRFDLIRAQLSYEVWIGSYQALPYPDITPSVARDPLGERPAVLKPGLILALLLWGLPLLVLADVLLVLRRP